MNRHVILWNQSSNPQKKNHIIAGNQTYTDDNSLYEDLFAKTVDSSYKLIFQRGNLNISKKKFGEYIVSGNYIEKDCAGRRMAYSACISNYPWNVIKEISKVARKYNRHISLSDKFVLFWQLNKSILTTLFSIGIALIIWINIKNTVMYIFNDFNNI